MKKNIALISFVVVCAAIVLIGKSSKPASEELTLEEKCAWLFVREIVGHYPKGMVELNGYTITESQHYPDSGILVVRGNLSYVVNGETVSLPISKTCNTN